MATKKKAVVTKTTVAEQLRKEVDIDLLLKELPFDADTIVHAGTNQAVLYEAAGRLRAQKQEERMNAKAFLELTEAQAGVAARKKLEADGDKVTVDAVKTLVTTSSKVQAAKSALATAEVEEEYTRQLLEAFRQRGNGLKVVGDLVEGELKSVGRALIKEMASKINVAETEEALNKKYSGRNKL